jgi:hypothetical protein
LPHPYSAIQALDLPGEFEYLLDSVCHHLGVPLKADMHVHRSGRAFDGLREAVRDFVDIEKAFVTKKRRDSSKK